MRSAASPSFLRRLLMWTSIVRSRTTASSPMAASISSKRVKARPAWRSSTSSRRNSVGVSGQLLALVEDAVAVAVDDDPLALDHGRRPRLVPALAAAQLLLDPLDQDLHAVRLRDIVVGPRGEADELVGLLRLGRHHHDRDVARPGPGPELPADLQAGLDRQHQVEHDQVGEPQLRLPEAVLAVVGDEDLEAFALQVVGQDLDQGTLVFDRPGSWVWPSCGRHQGEYGPDSRPSAAF